MAERLKLAVIGDLHIAVPRGANDTRLEIDPGRKLHGLSVELFSATIDAVNAEPGVAAALIMGDLTRDSEHFNHDVARGLLDRLRMPHFLVLGNHDLKRQRPAGVTYEGEEILDREAVAECYRDHGFPAGMTRYVTELPGGVVLVVLDSNRCLAELALAGLPLSAQEDGFIGEQQLAWLEGVLTQITGAGRLPLIAVHHTLLDQSPAERPGHMLYSSFKHWRISDSAPLLECLKRHGVQLVLSGHLHAQSVNVADGLYNLVTSATVSYPHAWRLLTFTAQAIHVESRSLAAIPSCPELQQQSRQWMAEGMGLLIRQKVASLPMVGGMAGQLGDYISSSGWWPRFCDGTLAGFSVDASEMPNGNPVSRMLASQVAYTLNEYGPWKAARPDTNTLEIPQPY
jgi:3',5'-cyclic AMP phosphodiesterase CpdA